MLECYFVGFRYPKRLNIERYKNFPVVVYLPSQSQSQINCKTGLNHENIKRNYK